MGFTWQEDGDGDMVIYDYRMNLNLLKLTEKHGSFSDGISDYDEPVSFKGHLRTLGFSETKEGRNGSRSTHRIYTIFSGISQGDKIEYEGVFYEVMFVDYKQHFFEDDALYHIDLEVFK